MDNGPPRLEANSTGEVLASTSPRGAYRRGNHSKYNYHESYGKKADSPRGLFRMGPGTTTLYTEHLIITQRTYAQHETYTLREMNTLPSILCFNTFLPPLTAVGAGLSNSDFSLVLT